MMNFSSLPFPFFPFIFHLQMPVHAYSSRQFFYLIFLFASLLFLSRAVVKKNWLFFLLFWSFSLKQQKKNSLGIQLFFYLILYLCAWPLNRATQHRNNFFFWFLTCNQHLMWDEKYYFLICLEFFYM